MHRVRVHKLGIPQDSRGAFELLARGGQLSSELAERMKRMVGFGNVAIHDYQSLNLAIVQAIIEKHLGDLLEFARIS